MKKANSTTYMKVVLFFCLQISFMFIIRIRSSTSHHPPLQLQEPEIWRSSVSLLSLEHRQWSFKMQSLPPPPVSQESTVRYDHLQNPITCERSNRRYDWCHLRLPTVLDPSTATFYPISSIPSTKLPIITEKLKPYPLKSNSLIMSNIREITLTTSYPESTSLGCQVQHDTPALVLSVGGFTGNFFHDFNDGFIPLFVTINTLLPNQDITLVITNYTEWWYGKYEALLPQFSKQPIINLDNQTVTHCFPSVVAGLITHGAMTIRPERIPNDKTFLDFRALLEKGYSQCPAWPAPKVKGRPRLVIVSRAGMVGRVMLNQESVIRAAQEEGFEVSVFEPTPLTYLCQMYRLINSSHVMVGVHGAALTHSLFLRPESVFIQVVPLGNDWLAQTYFRNLAKGMKLEYVEYKVSPEESSLVNKYGSDHILVKDAMNVASRNWSALHNVYLKGQDVRLNITRFKGYLRKAYWKAKRLMVEQGLRVRRRTKIKTYMKPLVYS